MRRNGMPETILMTTDTVGGVWIYALELARGLGGRGIDVILASMGDEPSPDQRRQAGDIQNLTLESRPYRLEWMESPWDDVRAAGDWLLELESRYTPDVIHLNNYAHGALSWAAPVLVVGHSCVCSWFHAVRETEPTEQWTEYRRVVQRGLQGAHAVIAPTQAMLDELVRHYGPFASPGVVHNARRIDSLVPRDREPFVLTAGRLWDEAKNVNLLDAAAKQIDWPVYAAGSVKNPDGGEVRFDDLRLLGRLAPEDLGGWMGRASIYALPAKYEPFGLTALEAALAGCALVLGDIPSLREIWQDAAVFVRVDDSDEVADAINGLARDPDRLDEMADRALRQARQYSAERMTEAYVDLYTSLRRSRKRRDPRAQIRTKPSSRPHGHLPVS